MNQLLDLCLTLTPPTDAPEGTIANVEVRCDALGLQPMTVQPLRDPFTPKERRELEWYLETYWQWPYETFAERGQRVEQLLTEAGQRLYRAEEQQDWAEAERCYSREPGDSERHGDAAIVIGICNQLASVAADAGRPAEAEGWFKRALNIPDLPPSHVATLCSNLANLLKDEVRAGGLPSGRLAEARGCAERALRIQETLDASAGIWTTQSIPGDIAELEGDTKPRAISAAANARASPHSRATAGTLTNSSANCSPSSPQPSGAMKRRAPPSRPCCRSLNLSGWTSAPPSRVFTRANAIGTR